MRTVPPVVAPGPRLAWSPSTPSWSIDERMPSSAPRPTRVPFPTTHPARRIEPGPTVASWPMTADGCTIVAGCEVRRRRRAALEHGPARGVVADGDDEVVGPDLGRTHREVVVAPEHRHVRRRTRRATSPRSSTPTAVWKPRATMASSTCRPWSEPPITITRLTTHPRSTAPAPAERLHRRVPGRTHPVTAEHLRHRLGQDLDVEPRGAVVDVPDVEGELLVPRDRVAPVHLRPAGDPRPHLVAARLLGRSTAAGTP